VATRRADLGEAWRALPGARLSEQEARLVIETPNTAREIPTRYVSADRIRFHAGRFQLLGRMDRIAKVEGKRVSLQLVEDAARRHACILDCAAILDQGETSRIALAVVLGDDGIANLYRDGKAALDRRIREALGNDVEAVALPRRIRYLTGIPVDGQGKVRRDLLLPVFGEHARRRPTIHGTKSNGDWLEIEIALDPDLLPFEGHFREFVVLPGVALVDWAVKIAIEQLNITGMARRLAEIKFTNVLRPNDRLILTIRSANHHIEYRYTRAGVQCAKGRVLIDEPSV
jgi:3-hydroxymyristoyl/3-hydroxydecanoyl-(acyl carrier protein) dehydratase